MMSYQLAGASTDALRQRNLSALLQIVARDGPLTRSDLARRTGLNRSTVGTLVGELIGFGFVSETYPEMTARVGRPSWVVSVSDAVTAITVMPGTDAIVISLVGLGGVVQRQIRAAVERTPTVADAVNVCAAVIEALRGDPVDGGRVLGACVAVPRAVSQHEQEASAAGDSHWTDAPFEHMLAEATGLKVLVSTDAHVAAIAESMVGAGRGSRDMLYVVGDAAGIRGSVIAQGKPLRGHRGVAGAIGHVQVVPSGGTCGCGRLGCLQAEIGIARLLNAAGIDDQSQLDEALAAPSPALADETARQLQLLGQALRAAGQLLDCETIVLDGYLRTLLEHAPDRLAAEIGGTKLCPRIKGAELLDDNVTIGAAQQVFGEVLDNPGLVAQRLARPADDSQHWSTQRINPIVFKRGSRRRDPGGG
jgi:predicted NBD/HSP70 family sugar kinase